MAHRSVVRARPRPVGVVTPRSIARIRMRLSVPGARIPGVPAPLAQSARRCRLESQHDHRNAKAAGRAVDTFILLPKNLNQNEPFYECTKSPSWPIGTVSRLRRVLCWCPVQPGVCPRRSERPESAPPAQNDQLGNATGGQFLPHRGRPSLIQLWRNVLKRFRWRQRLTTVAECAATALHRSGRHHPRPPPPPAARSRSRRGHLLRRRRHRRGACRMPPIPRR